MVSLFSRFLCLLLLLVSPNLGHEPVDAKRQVGKIRLVGNVVMIHLTLRTKSFVGEANVDKNSAQKNDESIEDFK